MVRLPSPDDDEWHDSILIDALRARDKTKIAEAIRRGAPMGPVARELFARHFDEQRNGWTLEFKYPTRQRPPEDHSAKIRREVRLMMEMEAYFLDCGSVEAAAKHLKDKHGIKRSKAFELWGKWPKPTPKPKST